MKRIALLASTTLVVAALASCGSDVDNIFGDPPAGTGGSDGSGGGGPGPGQGGGPGPSSTGEGAGPAPSSTGIGGMDCFGGGAEDEDGDGWTGLEGDCNDCDPLVNPNAIELPGGRGNSADEDCDGNYDNVLPPCDQGLDIADEEPSAAAQTIELCKKSMGDGDWGLADAKWVLADGAPPPAGSIMMFHLGHGLLPQFGPVPPRAGQRLLALSNGTARDANDPGYQEPGGVSKGYQSGMPPGFPKASVDCMVTSMPPAQDPVALEMAIRVPANATGVAFDSDFYSYDWPGFVCSGYDDAFFATLSPAPPGAPDGNVAFYANGNAVSLNGAPFDVCECMMPPCMAGGKTYACSQGAMALVGTGYETHAATGWQVTTVPVEPGSTITLRIGVFDAGDSAFSALALVDRFRWIGDPAVAVSTVADP